MSSTPSNGDVVRQQFSVLSQAAPSRLLAGHFHFRSWEVAILVCRCELELNGGYLGVSYESTIEGRGGVRVQLTLFSVPSVDV